MTVAGSELLVHQATTYQRLAVSGRLASATLLGLRETGRDLDGDPELELELRVDLDGARRVVRHCQVISRLAARELFLGRRLPVRVDPRNPDVLSLA